MTSEIRESLHLFAVSDAIDVRLLKVVGFVENAANVDPFTLRNFLQPRARWRIKFNGQLHRDQSVSFGESFEQPGIIALMVRVFDSDEDPTPTYFSFSTLCASFRSVQYIFALRQARTRSFS